jgi:hypothetical protein
MFAAIRKNMCQSDTQILATIANIGKFIKAGMIGGK